MYLEIFLADFGVFRGISQKSLNFAGPRPREISEALNIICDVVLKKKKNMMLGVLFLSKVILSM